MISVKLDRSLMDKLRGFHERVELRDETGQVVGYFQPVVEPATYHDVEVPFSEEELDRFEKEPGGRSLDEIVVDLRNDSCDTQ